MTDEWINFRLSDVIILIGGGTPKTINPAYWNGDIPWLSVADFNTGYRYVHSAEKTITRKGLEESSTNLLKKGQLIISARGTVGVLAQLGRDMAFNQSCYGITAKEPFSTNNFLYYLISNEVRGLKQITHGGVFETITRDTFDQILVSLPPFLTQNAIADILGSLDDKIEINRQMNETLEATARAIFQSWFVDFDPVRAKAEGRQPEGMDEETVALFPSEFEEIEGREVPKGWGIGNISEFCQRIENGGTPRRDNPEYWNPPKIPWLTSGEVRQDVIISTDNMISELGFENSSAKMWPKGATVVALYGATAGQVAIIACELCANQACCALIPRERTAYFNYLAMSSSIESLELQARGSAQQNLSQQIVSDFKICRPSKEILKAFNNLVEPLFEKWITNLQEDRVLTKTRDVLLPKLMSGEIQV